MDELPELPDPRHWPLAPVAAPAAAAVHALVQQNLAASASTAAANADAAIDARLLAWLRDGDGAALAGAFSSAPSAAVYRHLWRRLAACEAAMAREAALSVVLFALPLVIVAGIETPGTASVDIDGVAGDTAAIEGVLRTHGALGGSEQFSLSGALVDLGALGTERLPGLLIRARRTVDEGATTPLALTAAPFVAQGAQEVAHLRFLVGSLLCAPSADPLRDASVGPWGMPLARLVSSALARPGATVLALPRAPQRLVPAVASGWAAQREVALQLFAGNALRRLRASFGEPTAVISAHEAPDAPGGGELRVSLSSPFGPRDAEGFRFPLAPYERTPDAVGIITLLLRDCRVADVRAVTGIQPHRDADTGLLRFCKPDAPPRGAIH